MQLKSKDIKEEVQSKPKRIAYATYQWGTIPYYVSCDNGESQVIN